MEELKFGCTVGGIPQGVDAIAEDYFTAEELMAMNTSHRYGCIAAVDAWTDAGFERPSSEDHGPLRRDVQSQHPSMRLLQQCIHIGDSYS